MATSDPQPGRSEQVTTPSAIPPAPTGIQATPPRDSTLPPPAPGGLKRSQMLLAVLALVVLVFAVTFAMNYLGGGTAPKQTAAAPAGPRRELTFVSKLFPPDGLSLLEREHKSKGHCDYWFHNPHDAPLKVGLVAQSCKCTEVRLFYLPEGGGQRLFADAAALLGVSPAGPLAAIALQALAEPELQKGASEFEILRDKEAVDVPAKAIGWVRLAFQGEKPGALGLNAVVWMENKDTGPRASLDLRVAFHEALRVKPFLHVGPLKESDLAAGVTRYIYCWSATRSHLDLEVAPAVGRKGGPKSDPFHVGKPELLAKDEFDKLQREVILAAQSDPMEGAGPPAMMMCAYRIPVTLRAVAEDGLTPIDVGPLRRRVIVNCPDVDGDAKSVVVVGRVLGLIELGTEEDADINFRSFKSKDGKRERMTLSSETPGMTLEVDKERSSPFLSASLQLLKSAGSGPESWRLTIEVLPGKAFGPFPRKDDPAYEDCAVYLKATVPGQKEKRPIRIAVSGMASG